MITSIELQVISKILTSDDIEEVNNLCSFDLSYYSVFREHIKFILDHKQKYDEVPDVFTFQAEFPDITLVSVSEPYSYLSQELRRNKQHIILVDTFNKIKDLGSGDVSEAWQYIATQYDRVTKLDATNPVDLIKDAKQRSDQIIEFNKQARIPTGFKEIDKLMYGGLSTVEELLLIVARTNSGKSWMCVKMMEAAQSNGFPVLYYSPEMQSSFLGTRFDTWRGHFKNSQLYQGKYSEEYLKYIENLPSEQTSAFVLEDKDVADGYVDVRKLENFVSRNNIKLLIVDGLSYLTDVQRADTDYIRYKNICLDLFKISKKYSCAVVVALQANRETKESKDDKGAPFPNLYNIEGSDHPARICTQAFSLRQIFDKHVLDIRLEKSRIANNQRPILSYAWDPNTGNVQYIEGEDDDMIMNAITPPSVKPNVTTTYYAPDESMIDDEFEDDDVEF